ncbi:uncharacterized protein LOC114522882 isoform X2 [Dendronephthya gigantea]|uniref:uncharacterized protein LOC114522882 isoform X2 n=1 Tax=Dendronephthya gigantea TaxID=151771 RepID=UPI00106CC2CF|nr:uncharacterized protein LOC114522882 isoform X2 [Dendronephthya gigantea]
MNVSNPSPVGLQNYASIDRKHTFCTINTVRKTKLQIFQYIMASVSFSFPRRTSSKQNLLSVTDPHHSNEGLCKQKIMHPVFLSIIVCLFEELPLAVLRWNLKTSANNKMADGWGIASSIGGMTAPLLGPIYKCCKMSDCCKSKSSCCSGEKDETCCDDLCSGTSGWFGVTFLVLMVLVVVTINILNWANFEAPGAELCVQE